MTLPLPPVAGVIGWPVSHSKSPLIHGFWLRKLGLDGDYSRFPVHPDRLGDAIAGLSALGLRGVNVTVPHKQAVMAALDAIDPLAMRVGAVNTVVVGRDGRLTGYNSDVQGVIESLAGHEFERVLVIGAGGAARSVLAALVSTGRTAIAIENRDAARAAALAAEFGLVDAARGPGGEYDLLVNATSLGMAGDGRLPVGVDRLLPGRLVFDLVYTPLETPLLAAARARGMVCIDGLGMLIGQAAMAFELFFGAAAPRGHDAELRAMLTA